MKATDKSPLVHDPARQLSKGAADFITAPKRLLIGGEFVDSVAGTVLDTEDPATGKLICKVAAATAADVDRAVDAAQKAFDGVWRDMAPAERAQLMLRLADLITENLNQLAELESLDTGKPVRAARALDVPFTAQTFRYYAGWATKLTGRTFDLSLTGDPFHCFTLREPIGVVAGIIPWNYPLAQASFKLGPALAAGCTIVLKPAEQTPLTAIRLAELITQAGFPPGVVNILPGDGPAAGAALVRHDGIRKVSFTGSTEVGKEILKGAAGNLKRLTLELGGKSPNIVYADADLDMAIPAAAAAIFGNTGQVCNAGARLYVQRSVFDRVVGGVIDHASKLRVGAGLNEESEIGPLMSAAQLGRVSRYVADGQREGAEVAIGGSRVGHDGHFFAPTVLLNTSPGMSVQREEIFGPVLCAMPFDDPEEIAPVANETRYGLAASIWTRDLATAHRLARRLNAGAVWINCFGVFDPNLPFGGFKESGWGLEMAQEGVEAFTALKAVSIRL